MYARMYIFIYYNGVYISLIVHVFTFVRARLSTILPYLLVLLFATIVLTLYRSGSSELH